MAEQSRVYPGLDVSWPGATGSDEDPTADLVLAEADEFHPSAVESTSQGVRVFFATDCERALAAAHLNHALPRCNVVPVDVPDEHWAERSQAALTSVRIGAVTVAPPWDVPTEAVHVIVIQPSMGFGTGHHASTRLCLRLLQAAPVDNATVLDVGTGSGVLAIAARKLGARSVLAIDFDPDAIESARECAALNMLAADIDIRQFDLEREPVVPGAPFSLVLANLTGGMLVRTAGRLCQLTAAGGTMIVSGVTRDEEASVAHAFRAAGATIASRLDEEEWVGLCLSNRPGN